MMGSFTLSTDSTFPSFLASCTTSPTRSISPSHQTTSPQVTSQATANTPLPFNQGQKPEPVDSLSGVRPRMSVCLSQSLSLCLVIRYYYHQYYYHYCHYHNHQYYCCCYYFTIITNYDYHYYLVIGVTIFIIRIVIICIITIVIIIIFFFLLLLSIIIFIIPCQALSSDAQASDVAQWLHYHRFSNYVRVFQNFSGTVGLLDPVSSLSHLSPATLP